MNIEQVKNHDDYGPTYRRWLSVCLQAGRDRQTAEARAHGYARLFISRRIERQQRLART